MEEFSKKSWYKSWQNQYKRTYQKLSTTGRKLGQQDTIQQWNPDNKRGQARRNMANVSKLPY